MYTYDTRPRPTLPALLARRGFGDFNSEVNTGAKIAATAAAAVGGPVGAAAGLLIEVGSLIAKAFEGCGPTCVISSDKANQVGDYMLQNLRAYVSAPFDANLQITALNNFDTAWAALTQACGDPQLGKAGQNCISDRQRGACTWKASPGGWVADPTAPGGYRWTDWGPAGSGSACWNYFVGFRDPIANDPRATALSSITNLFSSLPISPLWIGAGLIVIGLAASGGGK